MGRSCRTCVNDESVADIAFDGSGVCSFCVEYESWRERLSDRAKLSAIWQEKLSRYRGEGPYDAVCGLSGGKDSTYVLHQLVRVYGLRVKAFTFSNGFMTDWARENIATTVRETGVDHVFFELSPKQMSGLMTFALKATGGVCTACAYAMFGSMLAMATDTGIPMAVHGRTPAQMLRFFEPRSRDPFIPLVYSAIASADELDLRATYRRVVEAMKRNLPAEHLAHFAPLFPDYENKRPAELAPFFLYHPYDEGEIVRYLEAESGWTRAARHSAIGHFDCTVCDASNFLSEIAEGRPHVMPEVSAMVRAGKLTRDEGLAYLARERFAEPPSGSLAALGGRLGKPSDELIDVAQMVARRSRP